MPLHQVMTFKRHIVWSVSGYKVFVSIDNKLLDAAVTALSKSQVGIPRITEFEKNQCTEFLTPSWLKFLESTDKFLTFAIKCTS